MRGMYLQKEVLTAGVLTTEGGDFSREGTVPFISR
jgi:hypothetical protein